MPETPKKTSSLHTPPTPISAKEYVTLTSANVDDLVRKINERITSSLSRGYQSEIEFTQVVGRFSDASILKAVGVFIPVGWFYRKDDTDPKAIKHYLSVVDQNIGTTGSAPKPGLHPNVTAKDYAATFEHTTPGPLS